MSNTKTTSSHDIAASSSFGTQQVISTILTSGVESSVSSPWVKLAHETAHTFTSLGASATQTQTISVHQFPIEITSSTSFNVSAAVPTEGPCFERVGPTFEPGTLDYESLMACWITTIVFTVISVGMTLFLITRHFQYYYKPDHQRWIVRILFMIPIYAICSCLSFRFFWYSIYFAIIRDCYEAFVIFSFFALLQQYLGGTLEEQHRFMQTIHAPARMTYPFPLNCFTFNPRGHAFLVNSKICILQYVVIRPVMTIVAYYLEWYGLLCPNSMDPKYGEFWISWINLISVCVAMYALVLFYLVIHHEIAEYDPLWKFIAVKFVVFFSFWQSIVIGILDQNGIIQGTVAWSSDNTADLIESFLISFEMVIAAFIHLRSFSHQEFVPIHNKGEGGTAGTLASIPKTRILAGMWDSLLMTDILLDIVEAPKEVREIKRMRKERRERRAISNCSSFDVLNVVASGEGVVATVENPGREASGFVIADDENLLKP